MRSRELPNVEGRIDGRAWTDGHDDEIKASVETDPLPWVNDANESVAPVSVYVSGDVYLDPEQTREFADHLHALAATVEQMRADAAQAERTAG